MDPATFRDVEVSEWGGTVRVRPLTKKERIRVLRYSHTFVGWKPEPTSRDFRARVLQLAIVDEQGAPLFGPQELDALNHKNGKVLQRLYNVAARLSDLPVLDLPGGG